MEDLVIAGDADAYLDLVDLGDPVFGIEHSRWADDWASPNPVDEFQLSVTDLSIADTAATGTLAMSWAAGGQPTRTARLEVRFVLGADGRWRYAGERWVTEVFDHFSVHVAPGLEILTLEIAADLPAVYEQVTGSLGYEPGSPMEIKVYEDASSLVAMTLLSLPDIRGWNEPGEALKVWADPLEPPPTPAIAHEFTHFAIFDRAGTRHSRMPWWLEEGVATFVAEPFGEPGNGDDRLALVRQWAADDDLADWSEMAVFEDTPESLWPFVYSQGYALVRYVTETYGEQARNAWLAAMAMDMDIEQASVARLGLSFAELVAAFEGWL